MDIENSRDLRASVRAGPYAWPGGYAVAYITHDGESLCPACVRAEYPRALRAVRHGLRDGWRVVGTYHMGEVEEPGNEYCAHCGVNIGEL